MISLLPLALNVGLVRALPATSYPYGLTIGTTGDVIGKVDGTSLRWSEAGPGGVSSASFTIVDSASNVTIPDDAEVRMWDYVRDIPMILGFIESTSITPWATGGRAISVGVYGKESLLDSTIVPTMTSVQGDSVAAGNAIWDGALLQVIGSATGLRIGMDSPEGRSPSSLTGPIGSTDPPGFFKAVNIFGPSAVLDGLSVRQAFDTFRTACGVLAFFQAGTPPVALTVDLWGGIRLFAFGASIMDWLPSDYATLTIDNTSTSGPHATNLSWKRDLSAGAVTNAVFVQGPGGGWVVGDTTSGRHEASTTMNGTTEGSKQAAAGGVMSQRSTPAGRGSLTLENYTPTNVHPGSMLVFTDTQMGWSAHTFLITQIDKSITNVRSGTQTWTVSFFDPNETPTAGPASAMRLMGTRTRSTPV